MNSEFGALRAAIHALLGEKCSSCGDFGPVDIHHVHHDGTAWRARWGLIGSPENWNADQALAYFVDILWGIHRGMQEVILLCRVCHTKHHKRFGYEER